MQDSFTRLGIQRVLFDLDDTLLETHNVFIEVLGSIRQRIAVLLNVSLEQLERDFEECQLESRKLHHVNPLPLWTLTLENLGLRYPVLDAELQQEFVQTIMQELYTKPIVLKEGALELVLTLIEAGIPIGIVTNASDEWTKFKLEQSGLTNYFDPSTVWVVQPDVKKTKEHWQNAIAAGGIPAERTLVFGDNVGSDIIPATELGALAVYLKLTNNWGVHAIGYESIDLTRVIEISRLNEFSDKLEMFIQKVENPLPPVL